VSRESLTKMLNCSFWKAASEFHANGTNLRRSNQSQRTIRSKKKIARTTLLVLKLVPFACRTEQVAAV